MKLALNISKKSSNVVEKNTHRLSALVAGPGMQLVSSVKLLHV